MICAKCSEEMMIASTDTYHGNSGSRKYGAFNCKNNHPCGMYPLNEQNQPLAVKFWGTEPDTVRQIS